MTAVTDAELDEIENTFRDMYGTGGTVCRRRIT